MLRRLICVAAFDVRSRARNESNLIGNYQGAFRENTPLLVKIPPVFWANFQYHIDFEKKLTYHISSKCLSVLSRAVRFMCSEFTSDYQVEETVMNEREYIEKINKLTEKNMMLDKFLKAYSSAYSVDLKNKTFEVLHMNHSFEHFFNLNGGKKEMERFIAEHVHPEDRENVALMTNANYVRTRLGESGEVSFSFRGQYDGTERVVKALIMRGSDDDHIAVGFMDITGEMRREREIREKMKVAVESKQAFLFNISHDIKTPMNAIIGFNNMAHAHIDDAQKVLDCLEKVDMSSQYLLAILNNALEMARIEAGNVRLEEAPAGITAIVSELITVLRETNTKNTQFEYDFSGIRHNYVLVDKPRLDIILSNILSNAVKYTAENGKVKLTVTEKECNIENSNKYIFTISDNGIGMSKDFVSRIFEPFSKETTSTLSGVDGSGLGMAITKHLVDLMKGDIKVESEQGKGTTVTICLVLKEDDSKMFDYDFVAEDGADVSALKGKRVLLVEDNELNCEIAKDILEEYGITVDTAENGEVAVEYCRKAAIEGLQNYPDLILMDIQMPVMDGYAATRIIRSLMSDNERRVPIVALTANSFPEDKQKARDAGMNAHLEKPINRNVLEKALVTLLK